MRRKFLVLTLLILWSAGLLLIPALAQDEAAAPPMEGTDEVIVEETVVLSSHRDPVLVSLRNVVLRN